MTTKQEAGIVGTEEILVGEGREFECIRRITGYLVGTMDRWNNAKQAEEKDRVKHSLTCPCDREA